MKNTTRAAILAVAASSLASPALANTVSTHATQLTLTQAANYQSGVTQGGQFSITGSGLSAGLGAVLGVAVPTITSAGLVAVANQAGFRAALNSDFSYLATMRQADSISTGATIANENLQTGVFSDVTSKSSVGNTAGTLGAITISGAGVVGIAAGTGAGQTATGIISAKNAGRFAQVENRRIVSSSNTQNITNSDAQQAKMSVAGKGMSAITAGGFSNIATAVGIVVASGAIAGGGCTGTGGTASNCNSGGAFNLTQETTASQVGAAMNVTSTALTTPSFGIVEYSAGGTDAGAIAITNLNTVTVAGGGAGTSSSLSQVGELTAFN